MREESFREGTQSNLNFKSLLFDHQQNAFKSKTLKEFMADVFTSYRNSMLRGTQASSSVHQGSSQGFLLVSSMPRP